MFSLGGHLILSAKPDGVTVAWLHAFLLQPSDTDRAYRQESTCPWNVAFISGSGFFGEAV